MTTPDGKPDPARPDPFRTVGAAARPGPGVDIAALSDLPDPGAIVRDFREGDALFSILLTRRGDVVRAWRNMCPHARWPLERPDGRVVVQEGRYVICSAHGASFMLEDGRCVAGPGLGLGLQALPIVVVDGRILAAADA